jgi:hypothetical protein
MRRLVELVKEDLLFMYQILSDTKQKYNKILTYSISFNKKAIESEALSLIDSMSPSDSYQEYERKRVVIIDKYADRDSEGNYIVSSDGKGFRIKKESIDECRAEIQCLEHENADMFKQREADVANFDKILRETVCVEMEIIDWENIPDDIDQSLMDALLPIINKEGSDK